MNEGGNNTLDKITHLIERIGIDKMVVTGFRILSIRLDVLKKHPNVTMDKDGELTYQLEDGNSFRWLKINDNRMFGTLCAGTKVYPYSKRDYEKLEITINDPGTGNLQNMTLCEYKSRVNKIFSYLYEEYGIRVETDNVKISQLEINCTFPIKEPFYKYHRVLRLMMFNLPDYYQKVMEVSKKNKEDARLEQETFYRGNKSMEIKIYDKARQLEEIKGIPCDCSLMRIEFVLKNAKKVKEVFKTNVLEEIQDGQISRYYMKQFHKLFEKRYHLWKENNRMCLQKMIIEHKAGSRKCWQRNLLNACRNYEQRDRVPLLLDINDLLEEIKKEEKQGHFKRIKASVLQKCEKDDVYLQNDTEKIQEIFTKINEAYKTSQKDVGCHMTVYGEIEQA